ncbi:hypothetical protein AU381_12755 [Sinorhizobium glycinis]|uniref:Uncharacterized protein n=1 Tax=Sinorhizobium glycinis TaxID=1472378 RepID=A0A178XSZ7_9HYPH|nr:hypothetical protein AU381_12755 [Sinorhizobium glycinis]
MAGDVSLARQSLAAPEWFAYLCIDLCLGQPNVIQEFRCVLSHPRELRAKTQSLVPCHEKTNRISPAIDATAVLARILTQV